MAKLVDLPFGLYEKALPAGDWPEILDRAAQLGFDFVEISIDESDQRLRRLQWDRAERSSFASVVRDSGLRVPSMCLSAHRRFPLGSGDPETVRAGVEIMRRAVDLSSDVGIRIVQVAGYDVYYNETSTPETRERFVENMARSVEYAAGRGVTLSVEIMDTKFMSSISRALYLLRRIPSPWLTVYPDVGNLSAWNDNAAEELELGLREGIVSAVHLKDTYPVTPTSPGQFRDVPFGSGCVDFSRMLGVLKRGGYAGPFLLEMWSRNGEEDIDRIRSAATWIRHIMEHIDDNA
ncbi:MAG: L-ribulose-5-phosphate 3-epimerase [Alkalispirochaeta sp.]